MPRGLKPACAVLSSEGPRVCALSVPFPAPLGLPHAPRGTSHNYTLTRVHMLTHSSTHTAHTQNCRSSHTLPRSPLTLTWFSKWQERRVWARSWPRMAAPDPRPPPPPMARLLGPPRERCHRPSAPRAPVEPVQLWRLLLWHSEGLPATQTADGQEMKAHSNTSQRTI